MLVYLLDDISQICKAVGKSILFLVMHAIGENTVRTQ